MAKTVIQPGNILLIIAIITILVFLGCSSGFPLWEDYQYKGMIANTEVENHPLHLAQDGAYVINIYEMDSVIGRKKLALYYPQSTPGLNDTRNVFDQLFLYFIDTVRFIYSRRQLEKIELKDIGDKQKVGLYQVYENKNCIPIVVLHISDSKVRNRKTFKYGRIFLERKKKEHLKFIRAEYPKLSDRDNPEKNLDVGYLAGDELGFYAEWVFNDSLGAELIFNKSEVAKILYNDTTRLYLNSTDSIVGTEKYKNDDRKSF